MDKVHREVYEVEADDFVSAGSASAKIKKILKQVGVNAELIRRAAIIS